jgi:prophage endopeptidase
MFSQIGTAVRIFAALALVAALGLVAKYIYDAGGDSREAPYLRRDRDRNAETARLVAENAAKVLAAERQGALVVADVITTLTQEKTHAQAVHDRFVDDVLAGRVRVRVPAAGGGGSCNAAVPAAGGGAGGNAGAGYCELSGAVVANLDAYARDVEQMRFDLNACRAILRADRAP